jgi:SIR2-like protein
VVKFTGATNCDCAICKGDQGFELSDELLAELLAGKVAFFAGAGISTESKSVYKETFLERRAAELGIDPAIGFPAVMSRYCAQPNGRIKLLHEIKGHFEHIDSFPEMNREASKFHRELATLCHVRNLITTNWDSYFERYCMATPFVADPDLAFWEAADRRVLKIHGSVSNFGSIVATAEDYALCARRLSKGVIGSLLKTILATQTVVFVGYSLKDPDFKLINGFVTKQMKSLHRQAYVVTPFQSEAEEFRKDGLIPIVTDGTYFVRQIKQHAVHNQLLLDDGLYSAASELLWRVREEHDLLHEKLKPSKFPQLLYASAYQDGLMHALERCIAMRASGHYSKAQSIVPKLHSYLKWQKEKLKHGVYEDVAYIEGYLNGLFYLVFDAKDRKAIPIYYAFGTQETFRTLPQFVRFMKANPKAHQASLRRALRNYSKYSDPDSIVIHHPPWL